MPQYLFQMSREPSSNLARDRIVTTFHIDTDLDSITPDMEAGPNIAVDAATLFVETLPGIVGFTGWTCRAYQHGQPKGSPPVLTEFWPTQGTPAAGGPREVALCLSYFADRNIPRRRGRMYIGPWASNLSERPAADRLAMLGTLAEGISGLGGPNVQWVQYSPTTGEFHNVTDYFIDDEWDTIRSRGLRPTSRRTGTVSG